MDILPKALSGRAAAVLKLVIALVSMAALVVFLIYGLGAAEGAKGQRIILLESLSLFWVYLAVPVGSAPRPGSSPPESAREIDERRRRRLARGGPWPLERAAQVAAARGDRRGR